ncbi:MAG TPA: hypothetical protein VMF67_02520 [Rhizomicrobium sp.]|nr:hypothetical protein [Rhizomicrobium sp.]
MLKALMAIPQLQRPRTFHPLDGAVDSRSDAHLRLDPPHFAISATLLGEEDFELGGESLDVFVRAGERVAGFLAGSILVAGVWMLCSAL